MTQYKKYHTMVSAIISSRVKTLIITLFFFGIALGFGKNKVQYSNLEWQTVRTPHFDLYYHQAQNELPATAARWTEQAYGILARDLNLTIKERLPLIVYGNPTLFRQTNIINEVLPEGVGGFTTRMRNRIVVPFTGSYEELRHVTYHELVHGFEYAILYDNLAQAFMVNTSAQIPLWFMEGLAEYLSSGWNTEADMFLMDATIYGTLSTPNPELDGYMAYKGGQSFLHYLAKSRSDELFYKFLQNFKNTRSIELSFKNIYGKTTEELGAEWIQELRRIYWPEIGRRQDVKRIATPITDHVKDKSFFNLKPRIAPNGKVIAYFSDLQDYTHIYIVDRKGKTIGDIAQSGFSGNFESFHPFRSGLTWSPKSDRLAFITESQGQDEIRIVNVSTRAIEQTIRVKPQVLQSPDWSPDGRCIIFCGVQGAQSDLYRYNLEQHTIEQLTNDVRYESDALFSPDGKSIVFCVQDTAGFSSTNNNNRPNTDLYIMNSTDRSVQQITNTPWDEKSPCFSVGGDSIFFICDRNGIDNIYTAAITTADSGQALTDLAGGCASISVARNNSTLAFCLFQKEGWDIYTMDTTQTHRLTYALAPTRWIVSQTDSSQPFFLKARTDTLNKKSLVDTSDAAKKADTRTSSDLAAINATSADSTSKQNISAKNIDKPDSLSAPAIPDLRTARPYTLSFAPDVISLGLNISTFYGYAGQWVAAFSDLLGNHQIVLAGDIQSDFTKYLHLYGSYLNIENRLNFGISAFFNRDMTLSYYSSSDSGTNIDSLYFDTDIGGQIMLRYPFSLFDRIDLTVFYQNMDRSPYYAVGGSVYKDTLHPNYSVSVLIPSLTYVFDNILWGITGPVNGIRGTIGITVSPPLDFVQSSFAALDGDVRHYWHINREFVWANRISAGASMALREGEQSVRRYFLGGTDYWLFYNVNREEYQKNLPNFFYSQMVVPFRGYNYVAFSGSRFAVLNSEFRFPFIRDINAVWPLPISIKYINGAVFTDIGNAWDVEDQYENVPLPKDIHAGIGFGLRANLGIFVLRYDRAWQTDLTNIIDNPVDYFSLGAEF